MLRKQGAGLVLLCADNGNMQAPALGSFRRTLVEDASVLEDLLPLLLDADAVGLDVEMAQHIERLPGGPTRGRQILALIQIAGGETSVIVDPLRVKDLSPLVSLMSSSTVKVVLGGATDIQLLEEHGLPVRHVADLAEMAVAVFGHKEEGMRALADRALGVQIDKSIRREDWLRRPIHPAMAMYAHRDAELTLLLYRWFQQHHPMVAESHIRLHFRPTPPAEVPEWIRKYLMKRLDPVRLLKEEGIDPNGHSRLVADVKLAQAQSLSPAQMRRLIRLIGELRLVDLYPDVLSSAGSSSSILRSAAARALGKLGNEEARSELERLSQDELSDVRSAAEIGLRDLDAGPPKAEADGVAQEESPGLDPDAVAVLERLQKLLVEKSQVSTRPEAGEG